MLKSGQNPPQQIPGTVSIMSTARKPNNQSLIHEIWQFDHDPNDSFLAPIINQKLKRHHSYEDMADLRHQMAKFNTYQLQSNSNGNILGEYHSMVQDYSHSQAKKIGNQYGLVNKNNAYKDKQKNEGKQQSRQQTNTNQSYINQLQRVIFDENQQTQKNQSKHTRKSNQPNYTIPITSHHQQINQYQCKQIDQLQNTSEVRTFIFVPPGYSNGANQQGNGYSVQLNQVYRDEDILHHRKVSNIAYLIRQTKQLLHLNKMYVLHAETDEIRRNIMRLQIQCRRLRISLRTSSSLSKLLTKKTNQSIQITARQQYGYKIDSKQRLRSPNLYLNTNENTNYLSPTSKQKQNDKQMGIIKRSAGHRILIKRSPAKSSSNIIKIESKLNQKQQQHLLKSIKTQLKKQESLSQIQQQLSLKLKQTIQKTNKLQLKTITKIASFHQPQPQSQYNPNPDPNPESKSTIPTLEHIGGDFEQHRFILLQKRAIIRQAVTQFRKHVEDKMGKIRNQNGIMREQLKYIDKRIIQLGRIRNSNSISANNSKNKLSRPSQFKNRIPSPTANESKPPIYPITNQKQYSLNPTIINNNNNHFSNINENGNGNAMDSQLCSETRLQPPVSPPTRPKLPIRRVCSQEIIVKDPQFQKQEGKYVRYQVQDITHG